MKQVAPAVETLSDTVFELDPSYHGWPTMVRLPDGTLLAAASGRRAAHVCPYGRVVLYRSEDEGKSWRGPAPLSSGPLDDRDAGLCVTAKGTVLLNYFTSIAFWTYDTGREGHPEWAEVARRINLETLAQEHGHWMRRSEDGGRTWGEKYRVPLNNVHGPALCRDGSLLWVGNPTGALGDPGRMKREIAAMRSTDDGLTWKTLATLTPPEWPAGELYCEVHQVEAADGAIVAQIRHEAPGRRTRTHQTRSEDGGQSWSEWRELPYGFPTHLLRLADDRLLMSYGCRLAPCGVRGRLSGDHGRSWSEEFILSADTADADLGYPSSVEFPDGSFATLWYQRFDGVGKLRAGRWRFR